MAKRDFYEVLGVSKNATQQEIKAAYRKLAIKYHPDRNQGDKTSEEKFKEAAEAYDVLGNEEKKQKYDQFGHQAFDGSGGFGGFSGGGMNMEDIFRNFGDVFGGGSGGGSPFGDIFGGGSGGGRSNRRAKGSSIRITLSLTLAEIAKGVTKKIDLQRKSKCTSCSGSGGDGSSDATESCKTCKGSGVIRKIQQTFLGAMQTEATCNTCEGSGKVIVKPCKTCNGKTINTKKETIEINIPAGVQDSMSLSVRGEGHQGEFGAPSGDLIVVIKEEEHPQFIRDDKNIIYNLHINFAKLVLGADIIVPTIDGEAKIKVKQGTQAGKVLRLKGKGIPDINGYGFGDQLIVINTWTPQEITAEERNSMELLLHSENFNPDPNKKNKDGFFSRIRDFLN